MSGQLIRSVLKSLGQDPNEVYYTNSLLCHSETKPSKEAVLSCNQRLREELAAVQPKKILLLGAVALQAFVSPATAQYITKARGQVFNIKLGDRLIPTLATFHPAVVLRETDYFRDLAKDVEKLLVAETPTPPANPDVYICWKRDTAITHLTSLLDATVISCDIETTGFSIVNDMILSVGFGAMYSDVEGASIIIPRHLFKDEHVYSLICKLLTSKQTVVYHNMKFDWKFLKKEFQLTQPGAIADTMLMHYCLDERPGNHGLKDLARLYFDAEDYHFDFKDFFAIEEKTKADYTKLFYYQGLDCHYTVRLYHIFLKAIQDDPTFRAQELLDTLLYPATLALCEIEAAGVQLDTDYLQEWADELTISTTAMRTKLQQLVFQTTGGQLENFNPASSVQVKKLLYTHWKLKNQVDLGAVGKKRDFPTGRGVLRRIRENEQDPVRSEILDLLIDYRHDSKFLSTYAHGLLKAASTDGRVRCSYLLHGTVTGRMSSNGPNLQNIPSPGGGFGSEAQRAFVASPDSNLLDVDYSQLELRVCAAFSDDPALIAIFADPDGDIHGEVSRTLGLPRKLAKMFVFGLIYGRSPGAITKGREMQTLVDKGEKRWTVEQAGAYQEKFLSAYPGLKKWLHEKHEQAVTQHYVESPLGRRRRFPFITSQNRGEVKRQGANSPIQGTASDICLMALINLHKRLPEGAYIRMTVHDSIVMEVRDDVLEETLKIIQYEMTENIPIETDVPFKIDVKMGMRWGEMTKVQELKDQYGSLPQYLTQKLTHKHEQEALRSTRTV